MKLLIVLALVAAAVADRLENTYLPPNSAQTAGGNANFLNAPFGKQAPSAPSSQYGAPSGANTYNGPATTPIAILKYNNDNNGEGTYQFDFETENHISQSETGQLRNAGSEAESNAVQGTYSYTGDDGQVYTINYVADENGFQPIGAHIPTAPPVPAEILKALEQNAADEAAGINDDGQYRPDPSEGQGAAASASRQYLAPKAGGYQQKPQNAGYKY